MMSNPHNPPHLYDQIIHSPMSVLGDLVLRTDFDPGEVPWQAVSPLVQSEARWTYRRRTEATR